MIPEALTARLQYHFQRANELHAARNYNGAIAELQAIFRIAPEVPEAHFNTGNVLRDAGNLTLAAEAFEAAIGFAGNQGRLYAEALLNLGDVYMRLKRFDAAHDAFTRAIQAAPTLAEAWMGLGVMEYERRDYAAADRAYAQALALDPSHLGVLNNRALTEYRSGRPHDSLATYDRIHALAPDFAEHRLHRALMLLLHGDYAQGFAEYEWRWGTGHFQSHKVVTGRPEWQGEDLTGKTILAYGEQGYGDAFQFARYLSLLAMRRGHVVALVEQPVQELIATVPGVVQTATAGGGTVPPHDYIVPILSLPHRFGTLLGTVPTKAPYIFPPYDRIAYWRARLAELTGLRVGLNWAGRPEHPFDDARSASVAALAPLAQIEGVSFVALQQGPRREEAGMAMFQPGPLASFTETAAIMESLDLVISVDTAICHLAGALGRPTWTMLAWVPEWRWGLAGEHTPWYPTMRLFRQDAPGDWDWVVERMKAALSEWVAG